MPLNIDLSAATPKDPNDPRTWGPSSIFINRTTLECQTCGLRAQPLVKWVEVKGGSKMIRAECQFCESYIRWVPTSRLWQTLVEIQARA